MAEKRSSITKTVWQQTEVLPEETMAFLRELAADYTKVKTAVYERYSGVNSFGRLGFVFDIQTQMRHCGLREQLDLPAVYFEAAVREAVSDVKGMWGMVKNRMRTLIYQNDNLSQEDRLYLYTVLKLDAIYAAVLERRAHPAPKKTEGLELDMARLDNLLRRLTRRSLSRPSAYSADSFSAPPGGYSYRDGQLWLASRERHKRVPLPLKDKKMSDRQIRVCLRKDYADIAIPLETEAKRHEDFQNTIYIYLGGNCMCTLSSGSTYGQRLGDMSRARTERLTEKNRGRSRMQAEYRESLAEGKRARAAVIKANNLGRCKYDRQKSRERAAIESYINAELNRMLAAEKPARIVVTKPVAGSPKSKSRAVNRMLTGSLLGYVRKRLAEKCAAQSVELVELSLKGTCFVCSQCGAQGKRLPEGFVCTACGYKSAIPLNGARNIENKYNRKVINDKAVNSEAVNGKAVNGKAANSEAVNGKAIQTWE